MAEKKKVEMIIVFLDGTKKQIEFDAIDKEPHEIIKHLQKLFESPNLTLQVGDFIMVIPRHSVKFVLFTPSTHLLPDTVLKGARFVNHKKETIAISAHTFY